MAPLWCLAAFLIRFAQTADSVPSIEEHPAWSILDGFECGESVADRIIGGKTAALGQLPWIARLGYTGKDYKEHPACSILDGFECGESVADRIIGGKTAALGQLPWIARLGYTGKDYKEHPAWSILDGFECGESVVDRIIGGKTAALGQLLWIARLGYTGKDYKEHPAWSILDGFECGESVADRIIGGKTAALGQLPWIARLGYTGKDYKEHPAWSILDGFECGESVADRIIGGKIAALGQLLWIARLGYTGKDYKEHPAWSILDGFECLESVADRIIGVKTAALGQLPWIARLGYTGAFDDIDWLCGGVLLSDRLVVTAAHCVKKDEYYNFTHVRLGEHDINHDPDCELGVCAPPAQSLRVRRVFSHEQFNVPVFHNDIAIVELVEPAVLNGYVTPICLPRNTEQLTPLAVGDSVMVAGWGKTNMTTEERADLLQYVYLSVLDAQNCSVFNSRFTWTSGAICAGGEKNKDACAGDSGGPLTKVYDTVEGPKHVLVGVVSFGPAICGSGNLPGIYVSVPHFLPWILGHVDSIYKSKT